MTRTGRLVVATSMAMACMFATITSAHAASWWTWYSSTKASSAWKSVSVGQAGPYNRASAKTVNDLGAQAYVNVGSLGTSHAPGNVSVTFAYQRGTFKCKWDWYGDAGPGPLTCRLGYN